MSRAVWLSLLLLACDDSIRLVLVESGGNGALSLAGTGDSPGAGETGGSAGDGGNASGAAAGLGGTAGSAGTELGAGGDIAPWDAPTLYLASYVSHAYPGQYIHYVETEGFIGPIDLTSAAEKESATFEIIPGLYDDECITFRALNKVGTVLRHSGSRIYLHPANDVPLFMADATFCPEPSAVAPNGISFRCTNYPQRMIHLRNQNELWIDDIVDTPQFASESTFYRELPLTATDPMTGP